MCSISKGSISTRSSTNSSNFSSTSSRTHGKRSRPISNSRLRSKEEQHYKHRNGLAAGNKVDPAVAPPVALYIYNIYLFKLKQYEQREQGFQEHSKFQFQKLYPYFMEASIIDQQSPAPSRQA